MNRVRAGYSVVVLAVVIASLYLVLYTDEELRLKVWPWLWIGATIVIGVAHARLDRASPERSFSLQVFLLCLAFTFLFGVILLPPSLGWAQYLLAGLMVATLVVLIRVRLLERRRKQVK